MKRKTYTDNQVVEILNEARKSEMTVEELCRKHGCSVAAFYGWKKKYGDAPPEDAKKLRQLERDNNQLLKLVGQQALEIHAMKAVLEKKW
jgi:putative transposase